jgi:2-polyprenyl-3-methyl-5-hydroxy-6-metoxy-1,4-benzoquinol methylase
VSGGFVNKVKKIGRIKTVFAFNLLEHVSNYNKAAKNISSVIPKGGYLFVSCPREFPYHPDPIDNGFRPTPAELAGLFPKMKIIKKSIIYQKTKVMVTRRGILLGKKYSASCLVIEK